MITSARVEDLPPARTAFALPALSAAVTLILAGGIAGFFYAYACSVMFGLDVIDPRHAMTAMKGINATVRNIFFAPAFFGTPVAALLTALLFHKAGFRTAALAMGLAALVYLFGAFLPTVFINVPMNNALAQTAVPESLSEATRIWTAYADRWTWWNVLRTFFSTISLLLVGFSLAAYGSRR